MCRQPPERRRIRAMCIKKPPLRVIFYWFVLIALVDRPEGQE